MSIYGSIYRLSVAILFNKELLASFQTASSTVLNVQSWDGSCHIPCCRGGTNYFYFALMCLQQPYGILYSTPDEFKMLFEWVRAFLFYRQGNQGSSEFRELKQPKPHGKLEPAFPHLSSLCLFHLLLDPCGPDSPKRAHMVCHCCLRLT